MFAVFPRAARPLRPDPTTTLAVHDEEPTQNNAEDANAEPDEAEDVTMVAAEPLEPKHDTHRKKRKSDSNNEDIRKPKATKTTKARITASAARTTISESSLLLENVARARLTCSRLDAETALQKEKNLGFERQIEKLRIERLAAQQKAEDDKLNRAMSLQEAISHTRFLEIQLAKQGAYATPPLSGHQGIHRHGIIRGTERSICVDARLWIERNARLWIDRRHALGGRLFWSREHWETSAVPESAA
ncbi:hypothetical protein B0H17DRAFT_1341338 [Mycena rosella]|uniref:Uncharacterized protein n=1 Tax=Mycena rosella TaxID=1033263 RepID=A0AAD7FD19_MYCRO|nr:hypothetical protein B0H17DRAFT_1341338 [Mycena rosella]